MIKKEGEFKNRKELQLFYFHYYSVLVCLLVEMIKTQTKNDADTNNNDNTATVSIDKDIDAVAKHLDLKDGTKVEYDKMGAEHGKKYNDGKVELYEFKEDSKEYKNIIKGEGDLKAAASQRRHRPRIH